MVISMTQAVSVLVQIRSMLELQDRMNKKVHPDWVEQRYAWYRAAWIECAELMDHLGYKWWKKQIPDEAQVKLEVVDIWHFALSSYFSSGVDLDTLAETVCSQVMAVSHNDAASQVMSPWSESQCQQIREATEKLAAVSLSQVVTVDAFWPLLNAVGMDLTALYRAYVSKNVLNFFRQDHGYKEGTYKKLWQGREDNEHLSELAESLDADLPSFQDDLYAALSARYKTA